MRDVELYAVPIHWIPQNPTLFNYANIFGLLSPSEVAKVTTASGQGAMLRAGVVNSLIVTAIAAPIATFMGSLAGYIFGRYRFRYKNGLLVEHDDPDAAAHVGYCTIHDNICKLGATWNTPGTDSVLSQQPGSSLTWVLMGFFATLPLETEGQPEWMGAAGGRHSTR